MNLEQLGWSAGHQADLEQIGDSTLVPARVSAEHRELFLVLGTQGERKARVAGRLRHEAEDRTDLPVVGDWVAVTAVAENAEATIHHVLPRKSALVRKAA